MKVLVTGATGFVGAHSAAAFQDAGHELRLLVRDEAKAARVGAAVGLRPTEVRVGDVTDADDVRAAVNGCDAVLHAAAGVALDRKRAAAILEANTAGARNVLGPAAEHGCSAIIHVSSTSALAAPAGEALTVDSTPAAAGGYAASKASAERIARTLRDGDAPVRVTYPSGVIGPAAGESLGETSVSMAGFVSGGAMPTHKAWLSLIDVRDLASIHAALLTKDVPRVMCGGTKLSMGELAEALGSVTGRRFLVPPIPPSILRVGGRIVDVATRILPFESAMTAEAMSLVTTWAGTDDNVEDVDVGYRPVIETLRDAIVAWYDAGLLSKKAAGVAIK